MHPRAAKDGWSLEKALDVIGAPQVVKARVLQSLYRNRDPDTGEIDPQESRLIIEKWTRNAHLDAGVNGINEIPAKSAASGATKHHATNDGLPARAHATNANANPTPTAPPVSENDQTFIRKLYDQLSTLYNPGGMLHA